MRESILGAGSQRRVFGERSHWFGRERRGIAVVCCVFLVFCNVELRAGDDLSDHQVRDVTALVRQAIQNEIDAQLYDNSLWCFREHKQEDGKPAKIVQVCGSPAGDLERVVAINGRELSAAELRAEDDSINKLLSNPAQLRAKQKKQKEDAEQIRKLLRDVPEAFQFEDQRTDGNLILVHFRPNPAFRPSSRAETVFRHLEGTLAIDRRQVRMAEMDGRITSDVRFLGGLLGHLDKGGTFHVKAGEVAPGHWDTILLNIQLSGKAFFFKTISVHQKEEYSNYTRVPDGATLEQVAAQLRQECAGFDSARGR
jgi:hypothetical protein